MTIQRYSCDDIRRIRDELGRHSSVREACEALPAGMTHDTVRALFLRHRACCLVGSPSSYLAASNIWGAPTQRPEQLPQPASAPVVEPDLLPASRGFIEPKPLAKAKPRPGVALLVPDVHVPYHDDRAWAMLLAVARHLRPALVVVLGDFADCYSVSFHDKSPRRVSRLSDELGQVRECLRELEEATPDAARVYLEGNHEARLSRYVARQAGALAGMAGVTLPELLELAAHGWEWVPYHHSYVLGDLHLTHDVGRAGVYAARQSRMAYGASIGIGHVHRMAVEHERTIDGRHHIGASFGWLGDAEAVEYRHRSLARREWVHGCGIALEDDRGHVHVQAVPFVGGRAWVAGHVVSA